MNVYIPILVIGAIAAAFAVGSVGIASGDRTAALQPRQTRGLRVRHRTGAAPGSPGTAGQRFPVKYYLTAMLFIVFDIEIVFLYPWAVAFDSLGLFAVVEMLLFMLTVFVAYAYVWRRGGLVGLNGETDPMGLEEKLPGGILLSTVEKVAGYRPQGLAVAGDVRPGLLCHRDDGHGRTAFRHRPIRHGAVLGDAAPGRPDDRGRPGEPEDGARCCVRSTTRWPNRNGCWRWASAPPPAACSTTTRWCRASTTSCRWTSTCPVARRGPRCCCNAILKLHAKIQEMPLGVNRDEAIAAAEQAALASPRPSNSRDCCGDDGIERQHGGGGTGAPRGHRHAPRHVRGRGQRRHLGYGRLVRAVALPGSSPRPYGGYFDDVVDALVDALGEEAFAAAVERVVVFRDELTLEVRRGHLPAVAQALRDDRSVAVRTVPGRLRGALSRARPAANCTPSTRLMSITHNRRIRLEVAAPDADPHVPSLFRCTRPPTGTNARHTTSSASSSTAIPR